MEKKLKKAGRARKTNSIHSKSGKFADKKVKADMAAVRAQSFKSASVGNNPVIFFDRPGDTVEGYIDGPFPHGSLSSSHFIMEHLGDIFEIKAHKLLRKIIKKHSLKGEYVKIVYRGRCQALPGSFGNACPKSYYVYQKDGKLVPHNYPPVVAKKKEAAA